MEERLAYIVVGVHPGTADHLIDEAAMFARLLRTELVCAFVDVSRYPLEEDADGRVRSMPTNPDLIEIQLQEDSDTVFPSVLFAQLGGILDPLNVAWSTRLLAGDPARALAQLANTLGAVMIVVGARNNTVRASMREFFNGSVAAHLAHRQNRPVLVLPTNPVPAGSPLPWEQQ